MQKITTLDSNTGLHVAKDVEDADVTLAPDITTGDIRIGNGAMTGDVYIKGALYPPELITLVDTVKLTSSTGQEIVNQTSILSYVRSLHVVNFTLKVDFDDLDEWNGNGPGIYAMFENMPWTFSAFTANSLYWAGPNPFPPSNKNDTFAVSTRDTLSEMWMHNYSSAVEARLETSLFLNQTGTIGLTGIAFIGS